MTRLDDAVIERFRTGDRAAFAEVVRCHQTSIYGFLRARLIQPNDADDLVQEAFLRAYQARERFEIGQPLRPWLIGIARNVLREHVRRVTRRKEVAWTEMCLELEDALGTADDKTEDALHHLPGCLESLGPSARQAVHLKYESNMQLAAIGEKLHRSEGAIKLLMFRARQVLRQCLNGKLRNGRHD